MMRTRTLVSRNIKGIIYRIGLRNREFTIISNNCWGGVVYDRYRLPYKTPTIGLWIPAKDYVRFVANLEYYLSLEVKQISWKECHVSEILKSRKESGRYQFELDDMIIGRLGDIDIIFFHYASFDEAKSKWDRRKARINYNNIIIKLNDQNDFSNDVFEEFAKLPYKNKLFITARKEYIGYSDVIYINYPDDEGNILDDTKLKLLPISVTKYLNQHTGV